MGEEGIDQRRVRAARAGMNGEARRLVHDQEIGVLVYDCERDVLRLTAQGYSAPEIGEKLFISPKTVDTYKQRINEKVGLSHRADYVQLALRLGLLAQT